MRIKEHPILKFDFSKKVQFYFEGQPMYGVEGEPIAAALHDNGVMVLRDSINLKRPRGFFCAIGHCSSCLMEVNGEPNIRVCIVPLEAGMRVNRQRGKGELR
ncbi:(2Fe-2S)-binding protein [bacterium]|nr:(2Fe-2S)-binding protein [bacterium]